jgi:hypothetical protein
MIERRSMSENVHGLPFALPRLELLYRLLETILEWRVVDGYYFSGEGPVRGPDGRGIVPLDSRNVEAQKVGKRRLVMFNPLINLSHLALVERKIGMYVNTANVAGDVDGYISRVWDPGGDMDMVAEYRNEHLTVSRIGAILRSRKVNIEKFMEV